MTGEQPKMSQETQKYGNLVGENLSANSALKKAVDAYIQKF